MGLPRPSEDKRKGAQGQITLYKGGQEVGVGLTSRVMCGQHKIMRIDGQTSIPALCAGKEWSLTIDLKTREILKSFFTPKTVALKSLTYESYERRTSSTSSSRVLQQPHSSIRVLGRR